MRMFQPAAILLITAFITSSAGGAQTSIRDLKKTVILISIDGFRADYFEKYQPPTINQIAAEGVRARWMTPAFPTKTFPNHYTIATGLYPSRHGIVDNSIWDFGVLFTMAKREEVQNSRWWLGEPIWVTAEKQGQRAAAMFFPGTEAEIAGRRPTFWRNYDGSLPHFERVDALLGWLDLPKRERPTFYTLYFSDVDSAGHQYSPDGEQTRAAVLKVDSAMERLVSGLKARKIFDKVNLIIVSDHGMVSVDNAKTDLLDDYIHLDLTERIIWGAAFTQIFPKAGKTDEVIAKLGKLKYGDCWKKDQIPERFNYRDGARVAPVICLSEEGATLTSRARYEEAKNRPRFGLSSGTHGYDHELESMRAIFVARGPQFKKALLAAPFPNVDVYNLMCKVLGLKPSKNDGRLDRVKGMLR